MTGELRKRLDDLAARTPSRTSDDAFSQLDRARARRHRSRKLGALVVALAIAAAGAGTALVAFDDDRPNRAVGDPASDAWTPPDVLTVWPENPMTDETPEEIQAAVDAGDHEQQWRTDPREVVHRFVAVVLGWSDATVSARTRGVESDARAFAVSPCSADVPCEVYGRLPDVLLRQPVSRGDGGIWSVVHVSSDALRIELPEQAEPTIAAGSELRFRLSVARSARVHVGVVFTNGCGSVAEFQPGLSSGPAALVVPDLPGSTECASEGVGYAFAYVQDASAVPVGDPFFEAAANVFPWMTIRPVRVLG